MAIAWIMAWISDHPEDLTALVLRYCRRCAAAVMQAATARGWVLSGGTAAASLQAMI